MRLFKNRDEAAHDLAEKLQFLKADDPVILGLANGGVPVGMIIAEEMDATLDVMILDRLYAPDSPRSPDHIVGAVDEHGRISMIHAAARWHHLTSQEMVGAARDAFRDIETKRSAIRQIMPEMDVRGRTVIIVDEGIGSGARMLGAVQSAKDRGAKKVVVAAPAGIAKATWQLHDTANSVVVPHSPAKYKGIEHFYTSYTPVADRMMVVMLQRWMEKYPRADVGVTTITTQITNNKGQRIVCELDLPAGAREGGGPYPAVIFVHGLDSDGRSARNVPISRRLAKRDIIGVRPDLVGHGRSEGQPDDATDDQVFADMKLLDEQLSQTREVDRHRIAMVASGNAAPAAIRSAAQCSNIKALVLRGPGSGSQLDAVEQITCPTLVIHGENDSAVAVEIEEFDRRLQCKHRILRIPETTRIFNDPISRELMMNASVEWLGNYLASDIPPSEDHAVGETVPNTAAEQPAGE